MTKTIGQGSNVTELGRYRKPMKNPILVELLEHWERLRAGRIAPLRSEIDPREIENVLEYAFILERVPAGEPRFRIAGMRLNDLMGMEVRAMPASSLIAPSFRDTFATILDRLFTTPEIVELQLVAARPGLPEMKAEMLLLPMKSDTGEVSRVLGCLVANNPATTTPHRFAITDKKVTRIVATDFEDVRAESAGFAEAPDVFAHKPAEPVTQRQTPDRGYLRLVSTEE